jgi:hypothetical protein
MFYHLNFCGGSLKPTKGSKIIGDEPTSDNLAAPIDCACAERHLEEGAELVQFLDGHHGMHDSTHIVEHGVAAHQRILGNRGLEGLDPQGVTDDLLGEPVDLGVHQGHVVVAGNAVAQGRQLLLNPADHHRLWQGIADPLELVVRGGAGDQQALAIAGCHPAQDFCAGDRGLDYWNFGAQLCLQGRVEIVRAPH